MDLQSILTFGLSLDLGRVHCFHGHGPTRSEPRLFTLGLDTLASRPKILAQWAPFMSFPLVGSRGNFLGINSIKTPSDQPFTWILARQKRTSSLLNKTTKNVKQWLLVVVLLGISGP